MSPSFATLLAMRRRERESAEALAADDAADRAALSLEERQIAAAGEELVAAARLQESTEKEELVASFVAPHTCHAEGCSVHVPPAMFACRRHWSMVPKDLQRELWRVYLPGQEAGLAPVTGEYILVQIACRVAIAQREGIDVSALRADLARRADVHPQLPAPIRALLAPPRPAPVAAPVAPVAQALDLDAPFLSTAIAVLDTETTGLPPGARVVEIAVVTLESPTAEPVKAWRSLCDPEMPIPWQATKVHGIEDRHVRGQPTIGELWPALAEHTAGRLLCAHNAKFDEQLLREEAALVGLQPMPALGQWLDTLSIARRLGYAGKAGTGTLAALCQRYEIEQGRHSAGSDAYATAQLLQALLRDVWASGEISEGCTVREFLRWQSGAPSPRPRGQSSLLDPAAPLTADQADELVRRGDQGRTSTEQSRSLRLRRSALAPVQLDLPVAVLAALPSIEDGDRPVPCEVRLRRARSHTVVTWELLESALWRALVERLRLHLEGNGEAADLWLPGWTWEEVREAAQEVRQRRAA